jgi:hypothetical protein
VSTLNGLRDSDHLSNPFRVGSKPHTSDSHLVCRRQYLSHECCVGVLHAVLARSVDGHLYRDRGLIFGDVAARGAIVDQIQSLVGSDAAHGVQAMLTSARKPGSGIIAAVSGLVVLILGATGAFSELYTAMNNIWQTPPRQAVRSLVYC